VRSYFTYREGTYWPAKNLTGLSPATRRTDERIMQTEVMLTLKPSSASFSSWIPYYPSMVGSFTLSAQKALRSCNTRSRVDEFERGNCGSLELGACLGVGWLGWSRSSRSRLPTCGKTCHLVQANPRRSDETVASIFLKEDDSQTVDRCLSGDYGTFNFLSSPDIRLVGERKIASRERCR
jgi:hypothetical protein